jgi:hypothetical protein
MVIPSINQCIYFHFSFFIIIPNLIDMKPFDFKSIVLNFDKASYSRKYSFIPNPDAYRPLKQLTVYRQMIKNYKTSLIEKLPANIKIIQVSPMTKVMIGLFVSILAIAEYLDNVY